MTQQTRPARAGMGIFAYLMMLIGGGMLLMGVAGAINTAFNLKLKLSFKGADINVPDSWDVVFGVAAFGVLLIGLTLFGRAVIARFKAAKGKPLQRVGILVGALVLLVATFRGLQVWALLSTYGSMLAYYATDGDLEDVKSELAKGPTKDDLDDAVSRAAQYKNAAALDLLLGAGADMLQSTREYKRCPLSGTSTEFIEVALKHGVKPATCYDSEALIWMEVSNAQDDPATAKIVALLIKGGWSPAAIPPHGKGRTALQVAREKKLMQTYAALSGT